MSKTRKRRPSGEPQNRISGPQVERDRNRERNLNALVQKARQGERVGSTTLERVSARPPLGRIAKAAREAMLRELEDRRRFHPSGDQRPYGRKDGRLARRFVVPESKRIRQTYGAFERNVIPYRIAFEDPVKVLVCLRRRIRREVLHALKLTGKGAGAKRHKLNFASGIQC